MNHFLRTILIVAVAQIGVVSSSSAQASWVFNGAGSSALYLEGGEAAAFTLATTTNSPTAGDIYECVWTNGKNTIVATDSTISKAENGQSWVAWNIDTTTGGTDCSAPGTNVSVYSYLQTDSVVGNRLLFNSATAVLTSADAGNSTAKLIYTSTCNATGWIAQGPDAVATPVETCNLPSSIQTLLETATTISAAGTDIRPEDAEFATTRALTSCGTALPFTISSEQTTQYLGLGYTSGGTAIQSFYSSGTFNVGSFTLPAAGYTVYRFGAAPIVVQINQTDGTALSAGGAGFADTGITNIESGVLASFLDGSLSRTRDLPGATGTSEGVTVLIREPLSGTYNTMEYNDPNTLENETSMDVGELQSSAQVNCSGTSPKSNPMGITTKAGERTRVIGTGEMENVLFGTGTEGALPFPSVLGWSFWSAPNLQNAYSGSANFKTDARYLTVDGIDPIQTTYTGGTIPTPTGKGGAPLTNVTMAHVIDGSYPIWSFLRVVCITANTAACTAANNLATNSQNYVALGSSVDALHPPDFVPVANTVNTSWNSTVVRSHFLPPSIGNIPCGAVSNGSSTSIATERAECGGDVGGAVLTLTADTDYAHDFQVSKTGITNRRR